MIGVHRRMLSIWSAMMGSGVGEDTDAKPIAAGATRLSCCKLAVLQHAPATERPA